MIINLNLKAEDKKMVGSDATFFYNSCPQGTDDKKVCAGPDGYVTVITTNSLEGDKLETTVVYKASGKDNKDFTVVFCKDGVKDVKVGGEDKKAEFVDSNKFKGEMDLGHIKLKADKITLENAKKNANTVEASKNNFKFYGVIVGSLAVVGGLGYAVYSMTSGKDNTSSAA